MSRYHGAVRELRCGHVLRSLVQQTRRRAVHFDGRNRLSNFWAPTSHGKQSPAEEDGHDLLLRAGFLRQAHSGIFHLLPLGLRVQDKVERLIDKHMRRLGASKVSLSSLSSQELWRRSGRLDGRNAELFQLQDRKETKFLLSPTHEEEITTIVKNAVTSYRDLPLRLYQVSRKYRDEARPRQGLLRGREFIMKDLYTFDANEQQAMKTYERVRAAYTAFFDDINMPYLVASADSGNMGGNHSHEYHFASAKGEDTIISCDKCKTSLNEELFVGVYDPQQPVNVIETKVLYGRIVESASREQSSSASQPDASSSDTLRGPAFTTRIKSIVQITVPAECELNVHAIKKLVPDLDTTVGFGTTNQNLKLFGFERAQWLQYHDPRIAKDAIPKTPTAFHESAPSPEHSQPAPFLLTRPRASDSCPTCKSQGTLQFQQAVEIGHTFHLGARYSTPLGAVFKDEKNRQVPIEMGCHGIGVSRLVGAVASLLADAKGLNWPIILAPFGICILGAGATASEEVNSMYDHLGLGIAGQGLDLVIDDREKAIGWKLNDADLIGYPFIVVLGKAWQQRRAVELQCRQLDVKEEVDGEELVERILQYRRRL